VIAIEVTKLLDRLAVFDLANPGLRVSGHWRFSSTPSEHFAYEVAEPRRGTGRSLGSFTIDLPRFL
jgi:hypothetical protein